ncbi:MAG: homocysteine S-methyltransferase family protein [Bacillota bacterium]|jgi:5-methyltetrahydrofolate--homocysteine methyltransferase
MTFLDDLKSGKTIIFDGGMGSLLAVKGLSLTGAANNLEHPDQVQQVHEEYIEAGADCIITNTLTLNEIYMSKKGAAPIDIDAANIAGAQIAKKAAAKGAYVFGDLGPTGEMLAPLGAGKADDFYKAYVRQSQTLYEAGVDGFIIETVFDLNEALLALKACKEVADLPVIVSLTFSTVKKGGRTVMGNSAADCAQKASEAGADVVGANCGDLTPLEMAEIVANMKPAGLPVMVQPNAGKPIFDEGKARYHMSPEDFASGMKACFEAGAQIFGGCCGTTPEHIKALADILRA